MCLPFQPAGYQKAAGGVAYVGVFGRSDTATYQPAFCFSKNLGPDDVKFVAECVSHGAYFTVKRRRLLCCAGAFAVLVLCLCNGLVLVLCFCFCCLRGVRLEGRRGGV